MSNQNQNEQQEKPKFLPHMWQETKNAFSSKKAWVLLVFFLILLFIGGFVPVGKISFLRNLAYAMGYTPDETQKISLLRALFSWNEHQKILRGELPDPEAVSVFGSQGGAFASASAKAQNKLINLRAVNASLARKKQPQDVLKIPYSSVDTGEGKKPSDIKIGDTSVSASTQANAAQTSEVYFGVDAAAVTRDKTDGYNSVNALKKIANPNISGAGPDDWMGRLVDKATRSDAGLANIAKNVDKGGTLAQIGAVQELGNSRAHRDLYHAWLYGKTARRVPNPVLKKTLASASFDNAEMPKSVFSASGFSGVGINPDDVVADMDSVTKYLEQDEECRKAMEEIGKNLGEQKQALFDKIKGLHFPSNCKDAFSSSYGNDLDGIKTTCEGIRKAYTHTLGSKCSINGTAGNCDATDSLKGNFTAFRNYCVQEREKCAQLLDPAAQQACLNTVKNTNDCSPSCGTADIPQAQQDTFHVDENGNPVRNPDEPRDEGGFLPHLDWSGSFWVGDVD